MVLALQIVVILAWSESGLRVQDFCDFGILACLCVVLDFPSWRDVSEVDVKRTQGIDQSEHNTMHFRLCISFSDYVSHLARRS